MLRTLFTASLSILLAAEASAHITWDPHCLNDNNPNPYQLDVLQNQDFKALKDAVHDDIRYSWCTHEKAELLMDLVAIAKPVRCVEIGTFNGTTALCIAAALQHLKQGELFTIDPYSNAECIKHMSEKDSNYSWWSTIPLEDLKMEFCSRSIKWNLFPYCTWINTNSVVAADLFDEIDFLHIDGNFTEVGALLDVQYYLPKVKSGGYIMVSSVYWKVDGARAKMRAIWALMDQCDVVTEVDRNDTVLFRKR